MPQPSFSAHSSPQVWRVKYSLALIRSAARELLTLDEKSPKRLFEGNALLRRLVSAGLILVLGVKLQLQLLCGLLFLERRFMLPEQRASTAMVSGCT